MIEKQNINGKEVWLKVDPLPVERENPNIIPTEYFTASYYFQEPGPEAGGGHPVKGDDGEPERYESPVAALTSAWKRVQNQL